jgi:hypothetical protein
VATATSSWFVSLNGTDIIAMVNSLKIMEMRVKCNYHLWQRF